MKPSILKLRRPRQRGVTLIEALVALMVMSFGMVALVGLLGNLRRSTDVGKQRSEAMRLAQAEMAKARAFSVLQKPNPADTTVTDYVNDLVSKAPADKTVADSNTTFSVKTDVANLTSGNEVWAKSARVEVSWVDRASATNEPAQTIVLNSIIARVDPAFSGAVSIAPAAGVVRQPLDRAPAIPVGATDLGDKTSALRPSTLSSVVWVFNNTSGAVTKTCSIDPAEALTATTVGNAGCTTTLGFVISGTVNFSNTSPANPSIPEATAINLDMTITGGSYSAARLSNRGIPVLDANNNIIMDTVTVAAPTSQCFDDAPSSPSNQSFVNFSCLVLPTVTSPRAYWSGALKLSGLSLGTTSSDYRVCRYSADYNGNGNGYANSLLEPDNFEHPAFYVKVTGSLARQNFLVIKGDVSCPTAPAVNQSSGIFADYSTVQIQP